MLRLVGAGLRPVPAVPYKEPDDYLKLGAARRGNGRYPAQRRDLGQPVGQYRQPDGALSEDGPGNMGETGGEVDAFTCAMARVARSPASACS